MNPNLNLYHIFHTVAECGNISAAANRLFISQPAISKSISRLEQKGFVERVRSDKDRRICHIQPTEKARAMQKTLWKAHRDMEERIRSEYGPGPYEQLMKELNRLLSLLTEIVKEESAC